MIARAIHRALDVVTDNGRHPEDAFLIAAAVIVVLAGFAGWLD